MGRLALLLAVMLACRLAQAAPDAGSLIQGTRDTATPIARPPAAAPPEPEYAKPASGDERVRVSGIRIIGAPELMGHQDVSALLAGAIGKYLSMQDLDQLADRITRFYRRNGYLVARAYVPAQDVVNGEVKIVLIEGRLDRVQSANRANLPTWLLSPLNALETSTPIRTRDLQYALQPLQDLPGVEVRSTLRPGATVGGTDLLVDVAPGKAVTGSADADNFGSPYTGTYRVGAGVFLNNPLSLADQVGARVQTGGNGFSYVRTSYQLPVMNASTRFGLAWSRMQYRLGKELKDLKADGNATVDSAYLSHALVRDADFSGTAQLQYDNTTLQDRVNAFGTEIRKKLHTATASISLEASDEIFGGGLTSASLLVGGGTLKLDPVAAVIDAAGPNAEGHFGRISMSLSRKQWLGADTGLLLSYSGQWSGKNLDSSQKMSASGIYGVRAYREGEVSGDRVHLVSAEMFWQASDTLKLQAFYDAARVQPNAKPWSEGQQEFNVCGAGVGGTFTRSFLLVRLALARGIGARPPATSERSPWQVWTQVSGFF
jgi:hemolysin activation/secretion protein